MPVLHSAVPEPPDAVVRSLAGAAGDGGGVTALIRSPAPAVLGVYRHAVSSRGTIPWSPFPAAGVSALDPARSWTIISATDARGGASRGVRKRPPH
jgi:hypothetical protein